MRNAIQRRVVGALAAVALVAAVLVPVVTLAPTFFGRSTHRAGAAIVDGRDVGFSFSGDTIGWSTADIKHDLADAASMGATWVRVPFNWATLEMHGKGQYNWQPADNIVYIANALHLKVDAVVSYAPAWARPPGSGDTTPPTNVNDYADFMGAAVRHFAPLGVHTWEIWNEPNLFAMWGPKPDVGKYTALLRAAYPKIKAADFWTTVLTGGTSPAADSPDGTHVLPLTFLKGIYANGGKGSFDAVAHHPSTFPYPSSTVADWSAFQQSKDLYYEMAAHGDGDKKIWATEIGFPTGTDPRAVSETTQGDRFSESLSIWKNWSFAGPIFMYSVRDAGTNISDHYQNFGVEKIDGTHKAGWNRIQQALRGPEDVHAVGNAAGANVTWTAPGYDYGTPITNYKVYAFPTGINVTVPGNWRAANLALPTGNAYVFVVQPIHNGYPGVFSPPTQVPVSPNSVTVTAGTGAAWEGNSGTRTLLVPVNLNAPSAQTVSVHYSTGVLGPNWTAAVPQDYYATSGTLTFSPGETQKNVAVTIVGDTVRERPSDQFLVALTNAQNANIGGYGGAGQGIIVDDD